MRILFHRDESLPSMSYACASRLAVTMRDVELFEKRDAEFPGKASVIWEEITALDGSSCKAKTAEGTVSSGRGDGSMCVDLGIGSPSVAIEGGIDSHRTTTIGLWHLSYLPASVSSPIPSVGQWVAQHQLTTLSAQLVAKLEVLQFPADSTCVSKPVPDQLSTYYVDQVPLVGFGSIIEYGMMFLARSAYMGTQLVFGSSSSLVWSSSSACGRERSLACYFNVTGCCGVPTTNGRPVKLSRRRNPLNMGLPGFNQHGSAWVSGQLANFFFSRMTPQTRAQVDARRRGVFPRGSNLSTIGIHIRGGDSCAARRFCPSNLTASYFAQAAAIREQYGVNRLLVATDNKEAAALCDDGVLGFDCSHIAIDRSKFESTAFIETRVGKAQDGPLAGSAVALDAITDIDMLADCDFLVLVLRSAVSRLALSLALARKGRLPPFVSMQSPWSLTHHKAHMKRSHFTPGERGNGRGRAVGWSRRFREKPSRLGISSRGRHERG